MKFLLTVETPDDSVTPMLMAYLCYTVRGVERRVLLESRVWETVHYNEFLAFCTAYKLIAQENKAQVEFSFTRTELEEVRYGYAVRALGSRG